MVLLSVGNTTTDLSVVLSDLMTCSLPAVGRINDDLIELVGLCVEAWGRKDYLESKRIRSQINCKLQERGFNHVQWWNDLRQYMLANRGL